MQVCMSSLHDLLDLSINPCVCGVLGVPCLMDMPLFRQNVSMFLVQNSLPLSHNVSWISIGEGIFL